MHCGCRGAPPQLKKTRKRQHRNTNKPPAQPGRSTQCTFHRTWYTLQMLYVTLQWPTTCPELPAHTLAGLCALWLPSDASSPEKLHQADKPHPSQITCPALPQHPAQAPPLLLHNIDAAFDLAVPHHGMPRACQTYTGRALCTVVAERRPLN